MADIPIKVDNNKLLRSIVGPAGPVTIGINVRSTVWNFCEFCFMSFSCSFNFFPSGFKQGKP